MEDSNKMRFKMWFLSILNGTCPRMVHGAMYLHIERKDVLQMTKDGLIECDHPEEWGGERAWPAPEMKITAKGRKWLDKHSRKITRHETIRVLNGETDKDMFSDRAGMCG